VIVLPSAPAYHDQRNQNETRRSVEAALSLLLARLQALEGALN
jgi:hypothetical protein